MPVKGELKSLTARLDAARADEAERIMSAQGDDCIGDLVARWPRLFHGGSPARSDLPAGWFRLVDDLCAEIDSLLTDDAADAFEVTQIKEKYGGLRFYVKLASEEGIYIDVRSPEGLETLVRRSDVGSDSPMPRVRFLVETAMRRSEATCMQCGEPGQTETFGGWVATLCEVHASESGAATIAQWPGSAPFVPINGERNSKRLGILPP